MKVSGHTSMAITAFCFMVLMLVVTAPVSDRGLGAGMDPGPVPGHYTLSGTPLVPNPALPVVGPDNTPILAWLQDRAAM